MNCQLYSSRREGECKPWVGPCGEGLVEAVGESIKVGRIGASGGMGVGDGEGYGASVIYFGEEAFGKEAVGVWECSSDDVGEGPGDAGRQGVRSWGVPDSIEAAGCVQEGGWGYCSSIFFAGYFVGRGGFTLALPLRGPGGPGRLGGGWKVSLFEIGLEGGGCQGREFIFSGVKLSRLPRVGEGQSAELGVAEHFLE